MPPALLDLGDVREADDHRRVALLHRFDQLLSLLLGVVQPRRADVGRPHARRRVDEQDDPVPQQLRPLPARPQQREADQGDQQELQKEQQALPQPLPQRVDV
jgi:hypothetical protein